MKLSPMCVSFLSAFLLSTTAFAEDVPESYAEDLFTDTNETTSAGELSTLAFVLFEKNSSKITPEYAKMIATISDAIKAKPEMQIELTGHTDNEGSDELNQKLSKARAEAVRKTLIENGVAADRINAYSFGKDRPLADNSSEDGKVLNRQVTIWGIIK